MRIIAGHAGGIALTVPKGPPIRPTPDRVKEAIFSSLGDRVVDARVLDLFAGSGALGLESVSRGAAHAVLVDASRFAVEAARANAKKCGLADRVAVLRADAFPFVASSAARGETFGLILADPPYEKARREQASLARKLLNTPALISILAPDGVLVMEHFKEDKLDPPAHWELHRQLRHGDTVASIFRHAATVAPLQAKAGEES